MIVTAGLIVLALMFAFMNGYNDSGSMVATLISTGTIGSRQALLLAAAGNFVGPFIFGVAVAVVVGTGIVNPEGISLASIAATLLAAFGWNVIAARAGVPSSSSHALVGGLIGGGVAAGGIRVVEIRGVAIVVLSLVLVPLLGLLLGALAMHLTIWLSRGATPGLNDVFRRGQLATSLLLSISHGTSNAQKTMGVIALILFRSGILSRFFVPGWVVLISSLALSLGVAFGGSKVIQTLGGRIFRLRPVHGFVAQATASVIVLVATLLGGPVSLNQVATTAIMGTGAAERLSKVRWEVARTTFYAWIVTLPATMVVAFLLYPIAALVVPRG